MPDTLEHSPVPTRAVSRDASDEAARLAWLASPVTIEGNGDLAWVCDDIQDRLVAANCNIYQRGGQLVRVVQAAGSDSRRIKRDPASLRIAPFDDRSLAELVTRHLQLCKRNRKTDKLMACDCPREIAATLLARREWDFAELEAVVEHPIMLPDGEVVCTPGFHPETGLLLSPIFEGFQPPVSELDINEALDQLDVLRELLEGFDFINGVDESVALAFLLTPFVRPVLDTAPAFAVNAHAAGSGKSTLVRTAAAISTGRAPAFLSYGGDPEELRKVLFSSLFAGDQQIAIDNVDQPVRDAVLALILTAPVFRDRILGQSSTSSVPTKAVISMNGNNIQIEGDLTRRVLECRLDPRCDRPAERTFKFDPVERARSNRGDYVRAALTIMSAYQRQAERVQCSPFGSFGEWSRLVREPLIWLGMEDPVESIRGLEDADPERGQLRAMLAAVWAAVETREFKVADLLRIVQSKRQADIETGRAIDQSTSEALNEALVSVCQRNGELSAAALGKWLLRMSGRIEGGKRFVKFRSSSVSATWVIQIVEQGFQGI